MTMVATAIYEKGILRPLKPLALPENTRVRIFIESETSEAQSGHVLQDLVALATDLGVDDLAEQHDHYLYGVEKQ